MRQGSRSQGVEGSSILQKTSKIEYRNINNLVKNGEEPTLLTECVCVNISIIFG